MGYKEDEIAAIQEARRLAATRSPSLFSDRPRSPALSTTTTNSSLPHNTRQSRQIRPVPRSSSLPRSESGSSQHPSPPPLPPLRSTPSSSSFSSSHRTTPTRNGSRRGGRTRQDSQSSLAQSFSADSHTPSQEGVAVGRGLPPPRLEVDDSSATISSPATPPKRKLVVTNGIASSPPPAYTPNGNYASAYTSQKTPLSHQQASTSQPHGTDSPESSSTASSSRSSRSRDLKRRTILPPRLSLHKDDEDGNDLTLWTESLLSAVSSDNNSSGSGNGSATPGTSTFGEQGRRVGNSAAKERTSRGPPPVIVQDEDEEDEEEGEYVEVVASRVGLASGVNASPAPTLGSPFLAELQGIMADTKPQGHREGDRRTPDYDRPALNESYSPIIPVTPDHQAKQQQQMQQRQLQEPARDRPVSNHSEQSMESEADDAEFEAGLLHADTYSGRRDSSRSVSTVSSSGTVTGATIVRKASIARLNVLEKPRLVDLRSQQQQQKPLKEETSSPMSSHFESDETSGTSGSGSGGSSTSSSQSQDQNTPMTDEETEHASPLMYYTEESPSTEEAKYDHPAQVVHELQTATVPKPLVVPPTTSPVPEVVISPTVSETMGVPTSTQPTRPTIVISSTPTSSVGKASPLATASSAGVSPAMTPRYRGWLSGVVKPLEAFIDEQVDPREHYHDLREIAEGESGSVFVATVARERHQRLRLSPFTRVDDQRSFSNEEERLVAMKVVAIVPSGSPKLDDLKHELGLLKGLRHTSILSMDALYVDLVEDSLWIRMELMERSLADVIALESEGLVLQERTMARIASDVRSHCSLAKFIFSHVFSRFWMPWCICKHIASLTETSVQTTC